MTLYEPPCWNDCLSLHTDYDSGGTGEGDSPMSQQNARGDVIAQEEGLIVTTLNEVANAESQLFRAKDSLSILRFYA